MDTAKSTIIYMLLKSSCYSGCDKSRTYAPEARQYYGLVRSDTSLFSTTCHVGTHPRTQDLFLVGTRNSCYLRTYILLVPYDLSKPKIFKTVIWLVYV
jgi:hypothetical protein